MSLISVFCDLVVIIGHEVFLACYDQFLCMAFAQLTFRESLRDIETCLRSVSNKLYHVGFRGMVSKSTLSDANEKRDAEIYANFAKVLMSKVQRRKKIGGIFWGRSGGGWLSEFKILI